MTDTTTVTDTTDTNWKALNNWFDTTAFQRTVPFTFGTDSVSQPRLRGPGRVNFDFSLIKNTRIKERFNLQYRAEFFNISNTPALDARGATTDVASAQFGQIVSGGNPRNIQFGLRLVF